MQTETNDYNPATDPYRVDEQVLRDHFAVDSLVYPGFRVVMLGRYVRGGVGSYAGVYAVTRDTNNTHSEERGANYCTHLLYLPSEADGLRRACAQSGHYDLTLPEAVADLDTR